MTRTRLLAFTDGVVRSAITSSTRGYRLLKQKEGEGEKKGRGEKVGDAAPDRLRCLPQWSSPASFSGARLVYSEHLSGMGFYYQKKKKGGGKEQERKKGKRQVRVLPAVNYNGDRLVHGCRRPLHDCRLPRPDSIPDHALGTREERKGGGGEK